MKKLRSFVTGYKPVAEDDIPLEATETSAWRKHLVSVGGTTIFVFKLSRLLAVAALTGLVVFTSVKGRTVYDLTLVATLVRASSNADSGFRRADISSSFIP